MASIFKGLAQTGAWGCLDEFNRINVEVLSVVAAQVKQILDAAVLYSVPANREPQYQGAPPSAPPAVVGTFELPGETIAPTPTAGMFVTINPGFAGRVELPANLKAQFRTCAMILPDLALICENMLMSEGFQSTRPLSIKFVTLCELFSSLSSHELITAIAGTAIKLPKIEGLEGATVYDRFVNPAMVDLQYWGTIVPAYAPVPIGEGGQPFSRLVVSTMDTIRLSVLTTALVSRGFPVVFIGTAGASKTTLLKCFHFTLRDGAVLSNAITMNYYMDSMALQACNAANINKRSGRVFGPPKIKKLALDIDVLNLPSILRGGPSPLSSTTPCGMDKPLLCEPNSGGPTVTEATVVASCALDVFLLNPTNATRASAVRRLHAWLAAAPSHFSGLVAALLGEGGLTTTAAALAVTASLAAVGRAAHLDPTAMRALALAGAVEARVLLAAHGARNAQQVVLGAGGSRVLHVLVSGARGDAHAEGISPAAYHQLVGAQPRASAPLGASGGAGTEWRIGSGRGRISVEAACAAKGFKYCPMPGDGACLFHSIANDLDGDTSASLRREAVDAISQIWGDFFPFLETWHPQRLAAYCAYMARSDTHGDELEMRALELSRGIRIITWELNGSGALVEKRRVQLSGAEVTRTINVLYSGDGRHGHFDSLLPLLATEMGDGDTSEGSMDQEPPLAQSGGGGGASPTAAASSFTQLAPQVGDRFRVSWSDGTVHDAEVLETRPPIAAGSSGRVIRVHYEKRAC